MSHCLQRTTPIAALNVSYKRLHVPEQHYLWMAVKYKDVEIGEDNDSSAIKLIISKRKSKCSSLSNLAKSVNFDSWLSNWCLKTPVRLSFQLFI